MEELEKKRPTHHKESLTKMWKLEKKKPNHHTEANTS